MRVESFPDGHAICADSTSEQTLDLVRELVSNEVSLIIADPPYGNIVDESWDQVAFTDDDFARWMLEWTHLWERSLQPAGAFYVWGGIGKPGFRPFFKYLSKVERPGELELANLITWKKRRAYGVQWNYLFTREELAYLTKGEMKKPRRFNVPLLNEKRGYPGYNEKYPARSEYYRRTNVWTDTNEIFRGKIHPAQKPQRLHEILIEVHTDPGECVLDPFAGCGTTAFAARELGRRFVVIENDEKTFEGIVEKLR